jgi:hypothetical protein
MGVEAAQGVLLPGPLSVNSLDSSKGLAGGRKRKETILVPKLTSKSLALLREDNSKGLVVERK